MTPLRQPDPTSLSIKVWKCVVVVNDRESVDSGAVLVARATCRAGGSKELAAALEAMWVKDDRFPLPFIVELLLSP